MMLKMDGQSLRDRQDRRPAPLFSRLPGSRVLSPLNNSKIYAFSRQPRAVADVVSSLGTTEKSPYLISCNSGEVAVILSKSEQRNCCILDMANLSQLSKVRYTLLETYGFVWNGVREVAVW